MNNHLIYDRGGDILINVPDGTKKTAQHMIDTAVELIPFLDGELKILERCDYDDWIDGFRMDEER